jgi:hypothetical protein
LHQSNPNNLNDRTTSRNLILENARTNRCTQARDRVLLKWKPSSRGLGERCRSSVQAMRDTNPYEPSEISEDLHTEDDRRRDHCPACSQLVSRWSLWNTESLKSSKRCSNCDNSLWLEPVNALRLVLVLIGIGISGLWCLFFGSTSMNSMFMFAVMPFLMMGISCWLHVTFGKICSTT